jgi:hypothetical protein
MAKICARIIPNGGQYTSGMQEESDIQTGIVSQGLFMLFGLCLNRINPPAHNSPATITIRGTGDWFSQDMGYTGVIG